MKLKHIILKIAVALVATFLVFTACTPQARLKHLLTKYPELVNATQTDTFYILEHTTDTIVQSSTNTAGLDSILDHYLWQLDSLQKTPVKAALKNYIINRPCLEDTLVINLDGRGTCKVWQTSGLFYFRHHLNKQSIVIKRPLVKVILQPKILRFWLGFIFGICTVIAAIIIFLRFR